MYVTTVSSRSSPPAILLRESYRDRDKVRARNVANISDWPKDKVEALRRVLKGETQLCTSAQQMRIERSLPYGHVAAPRGMPERLAKLNLAMIAARVIEPAPQLATARQLSDETAAHSLGAVLDLGEVDEDELYAPLDALGEAQPKIEARLARRHLATAASCSTTSLILPRRSLLRTGTARLQPRRQAGQPTDRVRPALAADGCPVAVEVFDGNTADPATLGAQIAKLRDRFGIAHVVLVGDRGMISAARIEADLKPVGLDWITALRSTEIHALAGDHGPLQMSLFDTTDVAEITASFVGLDQPRTAQAGEGRGDLGIDAHLVAVEAGQGVPQLLTAGRPPVAGPREQSGGGKRRSSRVEEPFRLSNVNRHPKGALTHFWWCRVYTAPITRAWRRSRFPRPYIWRLTSLSFVI